MFTWLRAAIVIGVIAYLSPARERPDGGSPSRPEQALAGLDDLKRLDALWTSLPEATRRGIVRDVSRSLILPVQNLPVPNLPVQDTLRPGDREPPWRGTLR